MRTSQNHGVFVGPFRGVSPELFLVIPEVRAGGEADDPIGEILPDSECEFNLFRRDGGIVVELENGFRGRQVGDGFESGGGDGRKREGSGVGKDFDMQRDMGRERGPMRARGRSALGSPENNYLEKRDISSEM